MLDANKDINPSENFKSSEFSTIMIIAISSAHLAVGLGIIGISTFIPAQLALINWSDTVIAFLLGIATIFELSRIIIGYAQDRYTIFGSYRSNYLLFGIIVQTIGLLLVSQLLGSYLILIGMILFIIGSATVTLTVDAFLVDVSKIENRNKYAAALQFFRLSGFALGGILGAILYDRLKFENFFIFLAFIGFIISMFSFFAIKEDQRYKMTRQKELTTNSWRQDVHFIISQLKYPAVSGMIIFLILYPLGLFLQDPILEPYAIRIFGYNEEGIGRLAGIWGTATLIFIPIGIIFDKKVGRMRSITLGALIGTLGLLLIGWFGLDPFKWKDFNISIFQSSLLFALVLFGVGLGLLTTPGTAVMLDVVAFSYNKTLILSFFGLVLTISRSGASFLAGLVMYFNNYQLLFLIESFFLLSCVIPIYFSYKSLKRENSLRKIEKSEIFRYVDMS